MGHCFSNFQWKMKNTKRTCTKGCFGPSFRATTASAQVLTGPPYTHKKAALIDHQRHQAGVREMAAAAKSKPPSPPLVCWKWPWDPPSATAASSSSSSSLCGPLEAPWLFKSLQTLASIASQNLFNGNKRAPNSRPPPSPSSYSAGMSLSRDEQGEAEQRALASALASGKEATVLEFYSPKCRLCNSLLDLVLNLEAKNSDWVNFVLADAENEKWLPEVCVHLSCEK